MADVILFSPRRQRLSTRPADGEAAGQIVFFTGVRYQRMTDAAVIDAGGGRPKSGGGVGKRKRKRG